MRHNFTLVLLAVFWFIPVVSWSVGESARNWRVSSADDCIKFRKPVFVAIGWTLMALLYPASFGLLAMRMNPADQAVWFCIVGLLSLASFSAALYAAMPKTITLDLKSRTCYETRGWTFQTPCREQRISTSARLLLCWTSNHYFVFLQTDSSRVQGRFLLSISVGKENADAVSCEVSQKLALPVTEGKLSKINQLFSSPDNGTPI